MRRWNPRPEPTPWTALAICAAVACMSVYALTYWLRPVVGLVVQLHVAIYGR